MSDTSLDRMVKISALYDLYCGLLTEKQQELVSLHYMKDLSLREISEQYGVSRQAVHDIISRAETTLEEAESSLGFLRQDTRRRELVSAAQKKADELLSDIRRYCGTDPECILRLSEKAADLRKHIDMINE